MTKIEVFPESSTCTNLQLYLYLCFLIHWQHMSAATTAHSPIKEWTYSGLNEKTWSLQVWLVRQTKSEDEPWYPLLCANRIRKLTRAFDRPAALNAVLPRPDKLPPCCGWQMCPYPREPPVRIHPAAPRRGKPLLPNLNTVYLSNWLYFCSPHMLCCFLTSTVHATEGLNRRGEAQYLTNTHLSQISIAPISTKHGPSFYFVCMFQI